MMEKLRSAKELYERVNEKKRIKEFLLLEAQRDSVKKAIDKMYEHLQLHCIVVGIKMGELNPQIEEEIKEAGYRIVGMDSDGKLNDKGAYLGLSAKPDATE